MRVIVASLISVGILIIIAVAAYVYASKTSRPADGLRDEEQPLLRPAATLSEISSSSTASTLVQDLNPLKFEIRLMRLRGGPVDSKLECNLQIQSLSSDVDVPPYEALSYVWADIPGKGMLYVDGIQQTITANLAEALSHLRYEDRDRLLWVDAVCINQTHLIERGHQVRLMGTVYARSSEVLIWLGPESDDSAQALQDLENLSEDKHLHELDFYGHMADDGQTWLPAPVERIIPLENLLKRAYWSRIWVVQEIVRAQKATVFCGPSSLAWDTCVKVRDNWPKHSRKCCNTECNVMHPRTRRVMNWVNSSWRRYQDAGGDLLSRLSLTRGLAAKDPRDKIFAALGLMRDNAYLPDPDYKSRYPVVFRDWAAKMIEIIGGLDVFLYTQYSLRHEDIPSWVPDWTKYETSVRFQAERLEHHRHISRSFNADGCSDEAPVFSVDGNRLRLAGYKLDTISKVGEALMYNRKDHLTDDQNQIGAVKAWNAVLESWSRVTSTTGSLDSHYPDGGGTYSDAYWRTLLSDHITEVGTYLGDRTSADDEPRYQRWRQWFEDLVQQPDAAKPAFYKDSLAADRDLDRFDWTIMNMNYNRRLFSTSTGRIGMGSADMEPGDLVVLFRGGRTPFVLRLSDQNFTDGPVYQIVGYAYVHGVMDGEGAPSVGDWVDYWLS